MLLVWWILVNIACLCGCFISLPLIAYHQYLITTGPIGHVQCYDDDDAHVDDVCLSMPVPIDIGCCVYRVAQ